MGCSPAKSFGCFEKKISKIGKNEGTQIDSQKRLSKIDWKFGGLDSLRPNKKYFSGCFCNGASMCLSRLLKVYFLKIF